MLANLEKICDTIYCQSSAWGKSKGGNGEENQLRNGKTLSHHVKEFVCIGFRHFKKFKGSTVKKRLGLVPAKG